MKYIDKIPAWLKNKYIITVIVFIVWMTFFDRSDFISQYTYRQELNKLESDRDYYLTEIEENKKATYEIKSNPENLEKFAREKYLMKKEDEDIFLIVEQNPEKKKEEN